MEVSHNKKHECHYEGFQGDEKVMKARRASELPNLQEKFAEVMEGWKGSPIALVWTEDAGADKVRVRSFNGGVGNQHEIKSLINGLHEASHELLEHAQQASVDDEVSPEDELKEMLKTIFGNPGDAKSK